MPLISGTHRCPNCNKDLYWEYSLPDQWNYPIAFNYTHGSIRPMLLNSHKSKVLEFRITCTKCNYKDDFTYDKHNHHNEWKWR